MSSLSTLWTGRKAIEDRYSSFKLAEIHLELSPYILHFTSQLFSQLLVILSDLPRYHSCQHHKAVTKFADYTIEMWPFPGIVTSVSLSDCNLRTYIYSSEMLYYAVHRDTQTEVYAHWVLVYYKKPTSMWLCLKVCGHLVLQYKSFQSKSTLAGRKKQPQLCTLTTFDNFPQPYNFSLLLTTF